MAGFLRLRLSRRPYDQRVAVPGTGRSPRGERHRHGERDERAHDHPAETVEDAAAEFGAQGEDAGRRTQHAQGVVEQCRVAVTDSWSGRGQDESQRDGDQRGEGGGEQLGGAPAQVLAQDATEGAGQQDAAPMSPG
ncbi:hypothetical protein [Streptomyces sp. Rer75]|uniref:hypothetical protein n=1 Tax=Streptomyces sp. Rer75 TaxID=2750011 RepID=UPI0015D0AAE0|nr:hypothetical protein [Streptomyces sp. Rer75]QLH19518.1 hypothetical protein HYQ63_01720 [Streptomyces sp. Rer75]